MFIVIQNHCGAGDFVAHGPFPTKTEAQVWAANSVDAMKADFEKETGERWTIQALEDGDVLWLSPMRRPDEIEEELSVFELHPARCRKGNE